MDSYVDVITALLPLVAVMVILQVNPYHALVIRGILGAVAALVYSVLGAADVALTEALVGTLLAVMLYAVAVRSSMVLQVGVLKPDLETAGDSGDAGATPDNEPFRQLSADLRTVFKKHHMQVELMPYLDQDSLHQALSEKEVHAICTQSRPPEHDSAPFPAPYHTITRLRRLYDIMQAELPASTTEVTYLNPSDLNPSAAENIKP